MNKHMLRIVVIVVMQFFAIGHLRADTYYYTGNPFTEVYGTAGYSTSDYLSGSITTATPLLAGQFYTFLDYPDSGLFDLPTFSITDGHQTIDGSNITSGVFSFALDTSGQITTWAFYVSNETGSFGTCGSVVSWFTCTPTPTDFTYVFATESGGNVPDNPGRWSTTATVPEPSSLALLGLVGAFFLTKKSRR
jgi:hypothetical protein